MYRLQETGRFVAVCGGQLMLIRATIAVLCVISSAVNTQAGHDTETTVLDANSTMETRRKSAEGSEGNESVDVSIVVGLAESNAPTDVGVV